MKVRGARNTGSDHQEGDKHRESGAEVSWDSPGGRWERGVEHQAPLLVRCRSTLTPTPVSTRKWLRLDRRTWDTTQSLPASGGRTPGVAVLSAGCYLGVNLEPCLSDGGQSRPNVGPVARPPTRPNAPPSGAAAENRQRRQSQDERHLWRPTGQRLASRLERPGRPPRREAAARTCAECRIPSALQRELHVNACHNAP